ncbi:uncharacterized protein LOC135833958 [Planococcus citri]|uniref:uncharacterized protein LOC135833958 n=1 Tax=Planococcus citri TaxID=170843 RepID=UPI0031F7FA9F
MGPNFKGGFKFTLFSLFIALHLTNRFVVADLPNTDLRKAISCMRQFFGKPSLEGYTFLGEYTSLTDGEYSGILCPEVDTEELHDLIRNNAQGDYEGNAIKECLAKANSENLFEHYVKLGQKSEEAEEHEKPAVTKDHQTPSTQNSDLQSPAEKMAEHEKPHGSEDHQTPSTQNSDLLNTPAVNFKIGVCQSKIETEFSRLTDEKEKKETVQCLTKCANNFMRRITDYLNSVVQQVMSSPLNKQIQSDPKMLEYIPNSSQEFTKNKFYSELDKKNETLSIVPITQVGKEYLITYSKLYIALNKYVNDRVRKSIADLDNLDRHLFIMLQVYQDCGQLDCAMGLNSTPLYNLIESGAQDSYWKILQEFTNDNEDLRNWMDRQTGDWKTFCKAFIE